MVDSACDFLRALDAAGTACAEAAEYDIVPGVLIGAGATGVMPSKGATLATGLLG